MAEQKRETEMVVQSEYRLNHARSKQRKRLIVVSAALSTGGSLIIKMRLFIGYKEAKNDVHQHLLRTKTITTNILNMNSYKK